MTDTPFLASLFTALLVGLTGLCMGSFITLASHRMPRREDVIFKSSHCPACKARLGWRDLFPVASWLAAQGQCRHCGAPVHWRYPMIEITTAVLFLLIYASFGLTWQACALMLLAVMLLVMVVSDLEKFIIPDEVHLVLAPLAVVYRLGIMHDAWTDLLPGFIATLVIGVSLRYGYHLLRHRHGLGLGDVKFLLVVGLWLDMHTLVAFLFFAGALGVITGLAWRASGRGPRFPFGPALAASLLLCTAFPQAPDTFWSVQEAVFR